MRGSRVAAALLAIALLATGCGRSDSDSGAGTGGSTSTTEAGAADCTGVTPEATEVGVTADSITIEVMADIGSPLSPGLFQANVDAVEGFAKMINDNGGLACRQLVVEVWDSKLTAEEAKNGLIDACANAFSMVGSNTIFNPDVSPLVSCPDKSGAVTGLPDVAASAVDQHQLCNSTTYLIQPVTETCPVVDGVRPIKVSVGGAQWHLEQTPDLHGIFLVPGDLPTTVQASTYQIEALEDAGIVFDATPKVSGRAEQAAFTPMAQTASNTSSNFVFNGSNDAAMLKMRAETAAQNYDGVEVWACNSCYSKTFLAGSPDVTEGTYIDLPFLPFEERDANEALDAYLTAVGEDKADNFGAAAWQAAMLFQQAVDDVVAKDGINGLTRAALLDALSSIHEFDAGGWLGPKDPRGVSECFMTVQVQDGKFERVHPTEPGTFDCAADNVVTVQLDPAAEAAKIQ